MRIRRYRESDHDDVWALHNLALEGTGAHLGNGPWDEDLHDITGVYLEKGGEFLVGVEQDKIVAMGALMGSAGRTAEIKRMRVHPDFQRRGHGQAILLALESRAIHLGYIRIKLDTTVQQIAAQGLYVANGHAEIGRKTAHGFEVIEYEKQLSVP